MEGVEGMINWRETRLKTGMSLRKAAREAGISAAFLSDIERGKRKPLFSTRQKIFKVYGIQSFICSCCKGKGYLILENEEEES